VPKVKELIDRIAGAKSLAEAKEITKELSGDRRRKVTDQVRKLIENLSDKNLPVRTIAIRTGVSAPTIRKIIKRRRELLEASSRRTAKADSVP
jgi:DNA invertase Pin-like site-specific DNA recombinase